ncbi:MULTISPECIES: hypothetical protein [unclassified Leptolyngbya]|uniref:hypothetical protein n=1 Tax=unclassified Leptolyngbya TaxID=2650499 RepID=UPI001687748E|nr:MULTISPECIES: hypothetical protein [unclassified Leptolyngbya]MBD1909225.1 hypothetical protein [Leptolyngbya sp. FACHB-8]MBD2153553.1 hypothetical protein [Leptolyngbya sp. FACHB-16]
MQPHPTPTGVWGKNIFNPKSLDASTMHFTPPPPLPTAAEPYDGTRVETKQAIAAYVEQLGDLYAYCYQTAQTKLGKNATPVVLSTATTTLFQAAREKFNP